MGFENYMTRDDSASEIAVRRNGAKEALIEARRELDYVRDRLSKLKQNGKAESFEFELMQDEASRLEDEIRECKEILREYCLCGSD